MPTFPWTAFEDAVQDPALSLKAKGLLALFVFHEDLTLSRARELGPDGKTAIAKAARELVKAGLLRAEARRDDAGHLAGTFYVYAGGR